MSEGAQRIAWLAAAMAAALVLRAPVLDAGWFQDDAVQIAMLEGTWSGERSAWDLFRFADLERDGRAPLDAGTLPWWSSPDLRIAMFRPLASALVAFDHAVLGASPRAAHLHSMAWLLACLGAFALALRERYAPPLAGLAVLLFALDESHTHAAGWIANRSTLVAETFGWLGVGAQLRAERSGGARLRVLAFACFAAALAAGEYGLAMLAYPFALALVAPGVALVRRAAALAPALVAAALFLGLRAALEFGTRGSGLYLDPAVDPGGWAAAAFDRLATLVIAAIVGPPTWLGLDTASVATRATVAAAALAVLAIGTIWAARRLAADAAHALVAFALAVPLAILPFGAALPDQRLLGAAAGGVALVAAAVVIAALDTVRRSGAAPAARGACAAVAALVLLAHGLQAPAFARATVREFACQSAAEWRWAQEAEIPDDPEARVLLLAGADFTTNASLAEARRLGGRAVPRSIWRLSPYAAPHQVTRTGDGSIEVQVGLARTLPLKQSLHRDADPRLAAGDRIEVDGLTITVLDAVDGEPSRLRFEAAGSLDAAPWSFVHATPKGIARVALPPVGARIRLAPPARPPACAP